MRLRPFTWVPSDNLLEAGWRSQCFSSCCGDGCFFQSGDRLPRLRHQEVSAFKVEEPPVPEFGRKSFLSIADIKNDLYFTKGWRIHAPHIRSRSQAICDDKRHVMAGNVRHFFAWIVNIETYVFVGQRLEGDRGFTGSNIELLRGKKDLTPTIDRAFSNRVTTWSKEKGTSFYSSCIRQWKPARYKARLQREYLLPGTFFQNCDLR